MRRALLCSVYAKQFGLQLASFPSWLHTSIPLGSPLLHRAAAGRLAAAAPLLLLQGTMGVCVEEAVLLGMSAEEACPEACQEFFGVRRSRLPVCDRAS